MLSIYQNTIINELLFVINSSLIATQFNFIAGMLQLGNYVKSRRDEL